MIASRLEKPDAESMVQRHFGLLIGQSGTFLRIIDTIPRLTMSDATVLISGETGTGKDVVARAIHYHGARKTKPFIPVNCAALPTPSTLPRTPGLPANVVTSRAGLIFRIVLLA